MRGSRTYTTSVMAVATVLVLAVAAYAAAQGGEPVDEQTFEKDTINVDGNDLTITFIGHGTLMIEYEGKVVHVDPVSREADYSRLPKADLVLLTHDHGDHLDPAALAIVRTEKTQTVLPQVCAERAGGGIVMANGDTKTVAGLKIEAIPAYNMPGKTFHPEGVGNGYVVTFGKARVYIAGDTENTPEMKALEKIDVAFLPMNLPYTMTPEMVADAARAFMPKILYPYHFGQTDPNELVELLKDVEGIEVRVRKMQ